MNEIACHLRTMFESPRVSRVSSRRARYFHQFELAVLDLDEESPLPLEKTLHFAVAQVDEFEDSTREFRTKVLGSFRRAQFLNFQGLARVLKQQVDERLLALATRFLQSLPK